MFVLRCFQSEICLPSNPSDRCVESFEKTEINEISSIRISTALLICQAFFHVLGFVCQRFVTGHPEEFGSLESKRQI
ncbi:hypothetical protein M514_16402 [Trichuris suis]|uniref:Uncharacterized protein n=1 Tax=Trichuris suis TaxID=68888 RepID=A0A085NPS4_9BILA|nr:hypothetical protein M514_16402 [Trichuris suis]